MEKCDSGVPFKGQCVGCFADSREQYYDPQQQICVSIEKCAYVDEGTRTCRSLGEAVCPKFRKATISGTSVNVCVKKCESSYFELGHECVTVCLAPLVAGPGRVCIPSGAEKCAGFFDRERSSCVSECARLNREEWTCEVAGQRCEFLAESLLISPAYSDGRICVDSCGSPAVVRSDSETCTGSCAIGEFPNSEGKCESDCEIVAWDGARGLTCIDKCSGITVPGLLSSRTEAKLCVEVPAGADPEVVCTAVGQFYSRASGNCVTECTYRNGSFCEVIGSAECPYAFPRDSAGLEIENPSRVFDCVQDCQGRPVFAGECV